MGRTRRGATRRERWAKGLRCAWKKEERRESRDRLIDGGGTVNCTVVGRVRGGWVPLCKNAAQGRNGWGGVYSAPEAKG